MKVYFEKMQIVYLRASVQVFGYNFEHAITQPSEKYGIYCEDTCQLIKVCDSYNMALNFCEENEFEVIA